MICPCNVAFISFVLQQTVIARKYVCIRTPLELGKLQKVKEKKKFRKRLFLSNFRNFFDMLRRKRCRIIVPIGSLQT